MTSRVVTLPRRPKPAPKPIEHAYTSPTAEERSAADALKRAADALHRLTAMPFVTAASLAQAPRLIAEAQAALASLKDALA